MTFAITKIDSIKQDFLSAFEYNPETGVFLWKIARSRGIRPGMVAGSQKQDGYISLHVNGKTLPAHRVAWMFVYNDFPDTNLDHINRIKNDNRISNLRLATPEHNAQNRACNRLNKSGCKGVVWHKRDKRWQASITVKGQKLHLGLYGTKEDAATAYQQASLKYQTHSVFRSV